MYVSLNYMHLKVQVCMHASKWKDLVCQTKKIKINIFLEFLQDTVTY